MNLTTYFAFLGVAVLLILIIMWYVYEESYRHKPKHKSEPYIRDRVSSSMGDGTMSPFKPMHHVSHSTHPTPLAQHESPMTHSKPMSKPMHETNVTDSEMIAEHVYPSEALESTLHPALDM